MSELYPEIEPHASGWLDVGDGQKVYWESCGQPTGKPALVVHGGPGSGCSPGLRRIFDPLRYRMVLFDQRGCGRSTPHASDPSAELRHNTTPHLVDDMERLRAHLGIERWLLAGGSWGSTLALAYAEAHPQRVSEIVLTAVTTGRRREADWLYRGARCLFPGEWERFRAGVPEARGDEDVVRAYAARMEHPDAAVRSEAALRWCAWEDAVVSLEPGAKPDAYSGVSEAERLAFVRICTHYVSHDAWLADEALLAGASRLAGIPGVLIHGRLDLSCPFETAFELARRWPSAQLVALAKSGHQASPEKREAMLRALDGFARR